MEVRTAYTQDDSETTATLYMDWEFVQNRHLIYGLRVYLSKVFRTGLTYTAKSRA